MQKDTATIVIATVVLSAAIVGGQWYYNTVYLPGQADDLLPVHENQMPIEGSDEFGFYFDPTARTDQIIECEDPEIGTFYTNAAACEGADLENRLSEAQDLPVSIARELYRKKNAVRKQAARSNNQRNNPNLRLHAQAPPANLPPECRFPVGKALETERSMSVADDPAKSIWTETYCRFRCEVIEEKCPVSSNIFRYSFNRICRSTQYAKCPSWRPR